MTKKQSGVRHDLPRRIQLSTPKTPWWKSGTMIEVYELAVLGVAFTAASFIVRWAI